jgi:septal ring factor EnvC (AmiA/AmiB activator)
MPERLHSPLKPPPPTAGRSSPHGFISCAALASAILLTSVFALQAAEIGVIAVDNLNLRPEPGTRKPPVMQLKKGTRVEIEGSANGWLRVRYAGRTGFIIDRKDYVTITKEDADEKIAAFQRESQALKRKIEETEARISAVRQRETAVVNRIDELDRSIDRARRRLKANRQELESLENQIRSKQTAYEQLRARIAANQAYAAKRLVALYKLSRRGTVSVLASSGSFFEMMKRKKYLGRILAHDDQVRRRLLADKTRLQELMAHLASQQHQKKRIEADIAEQITTMSEHRTKRARILAQIRSEKSLQRAAIASLKANARILDQTIEKLASRAKTRTAAVHPASFSAHKGLLNMPIGGKIIRFFGFHKDTKFDVSVFHSGIGIKAPKGAVIQSVFAGRVLFAEWFKGYGNMVIIDHGDGYYTVYAHLEDLFKQAGSHVKTGEDIATLGVTAAPEGPVLHFEVRHHGKPLDPLDWIGKG